MSDQKFYCAGCGEPVNTANRCPRGCSLVEAPVDRYDMGYAQGLEDAAKECALLFDAGQSGLYGNGCLDCAAAIRALHRAE